MFYLDYLAYHNRFAQVSFLEKLFWGLSGLFLATTTGRLGVELAVFIVMSTILLWAGMPLRYWFRLWLALSPFLFTAAVTILLSVSRQPVTAALWLVQVGPVYIGVSEAGLVAAGAALLRSVSATSCLLMLAGTTPISYLAAWGSQIGFLRPVLEVALLAYRFIFVVIHTAAQIYTAQQSRLGYADFSRSLRSLAILAANLGRKSFLTAHELFIGLLSRNYSDRLVFRYPRQTVRPVRLALISGVVAYLAYYA